MVKLWGGVECTTNRVGDTFIDQTMLTGHHARGSDLDLFASLGISRMRYPVLWERTAPHGIEAADWSWPDERLDRLRQLGIEPIVGLLHHGSGPPGTSLIDPDFPVKFARYARAVARRYPWVLDWSPVNEPVTTARLSALYGLWYPHGRSSALFVRALVNQVLAIALAMREIREIIPDARLVQTEDCGHIGSSANLQYQAAFENRRQVSGFDLLTGRVTPEHPLWRYLVQEGAGQRDALLQLAREPCPPSVIGINYYVTSDRYLDDRLEGYPVEYQGGNGRHRYADVPAARVEGIGIVGHLAVLKRLWDRYHIPLAITEVHLGGGMDDQLRWLAEAWMAAADASGDGVLVEAVTAWSLMGAYGWDELVTRTDGRYEPGVFDLRFSPPRATGLSQMVQALSQLAAQDRQDRQDKQDRHDSEDSPDRHRRGSQAQNPVDLTPGWWRRQDGILFRPSSTPFALPGEQSDHYRDRDESRSSHPLTSPWVSAPIS